MAFPLISRHALLFFTPFSPVYLLCSLLRKKLLPPRLCTMATPRSRGLRYQAINWGHITIFSRFHLCGYHLPGLSPTDQSAVIPYLAVHSPSSLAHSSPVRCHAPRARDLLRPCKPPGPRLWCASPTDPVGAAHKSVAHASQVLRRERHQCERIPAASVFSILMRVPVRSRPFCSASSLPLGSAAAASSATTAPLPQPLPLVHPPTPPQKLPLLPPFPPSVPPTATPSSSGLPAHPTYPPWIQYKYNNVNIFVLSHAPHHYRQHWACGQIMP